MRSARASIHSSPQGQGPPTNSGAVHPNPSASGCEVMIMVRKNSCASTVETFYLDNVGISYQSTSTQPVLVKAGYRYGFNGQEKDNEVMGEGNSYTAKYWQYDSRLGRRWNLDPKYTGSESRYTAFSNNPIIYVERLGDFRTKFGARLYKWTHGGEIRQDKESGQWFVGKQVKYKGEGAGVAYQRRFDWNGGDKPYTGSGWGHTERSLAANVFGVNGQASSLFDLGWNSVFQNNSVQLTGDLLEQVKQDPAVQSLENSLVCRLQADSRFCKEAFTYSSTNNRVQLGGKRGSLNPLDESSAQTWEVALNPLTWAVRSVNIEVQVKVSAEGAMNITYQFTDNFDLRPENGDKVYFGGTGDSPFPSGGGYRPWEYNAATSILGVPYHDVVGGNDKLKVNATWQSNS